MTYVEGFVLAVPAENREAFRAHAEGLAPLFRECGVQRQIECWGDDVPRGKLTDFYGAVQAKEDENVVFAWFEYPDKAARDAANEKMRSDPRMQPTEAPPFDGQRMIFGGFSPIVQEGESRGTGYADGFIVPVPDGKKEAYRAMAARAAPIFQEYGANRVIEAWGDDVPDGKVTDYKMAVKAEDGENVVFSWIEWPDKATRDAGWAKVMQDERMQPPAEMPFDGKRMFWGGFAPLIDTAA
jgi:uncharacterized protein YbaA (DUF1428 family)